MGMSDDVDYILQAISNEVRRRILIYIARDGPISYTKLMKKVGIEDSGTFGFHIRKMQRLLRKDDVGEYVLSDLGRRAIEILRNIGYDVGEAVEAPARVETPAEDKPREVKVIDDMLSYTLTEEVVRRYRERGYRIILKDILRLVIGPMPRDLFDSVVEEINDCLTVYYPSDLRDVIEFKIRDVF